VLILFLTGSVHLVLTNEKAEWFDTKMDEFAPSEYHEMKFGVTMPLEISGIFYSKEDGEDRFKMWMAILDATDEVNVEIIKVFLSDLAWQVNNTYSIELTDRFFEQARKRGKKLMLLFDYGGTYPPNFTWEKYRELALRNVRFFTKRYEPEYFIVMQEITTTVEIYLVEPVGVDKWIELTKELIRIVKEESPDTKIVVSPAVGFLFPKENEYYEELLHLEGVDIIGFQMFTPYSIEEANHALSRFHPHDYGKELWIIESWYTLWGSWYQPWNKENDAKWIKLMTYYAQKNGFDGFISFYSSLFISYESHLLDKINYTERTPAFYAYKEIIEEVRKNTKR
jgi:hypothetical protein